MKPIAPPSSLLAPLLLLLALAAPAGADQLIQIPTADRASGPHVEYLHRLDGADEGYATALVPAGQAYELMFRYYNNFDGQHRVEGGGQFQLLPDGILTPAISLGIWDVTNSSPFGRRGFLVLSKSLTEGQYFVPRPIERLHLTLGVGTGRLGWLFAGGRVDLPAHFSLIGEYDARRLNLGLWYSPSRRVSLKLELQNNNPFFGGELRGRF
jgi:hypothetical protein